MRCLVALTITIFEYEYGNPPTTPKPRTKTGRAYGSAIIVGLLIVAAAALQAYGAWRLEKYIIRLNSFRAFDALLAPDELKPSLGRGLAVSEITIHVWLGIAWLAAFLLALSGVWMAVRRRLGWRMLWTGAVATILAGASTFAGGYVLEWYALFPPQAMRIYLIAFLIHSLPGWIILGIWLIWRLFVRKPAPPPAAETP
jgi:hypothetical protein